SLVDSGFSWGVHVGLERDERMGGDRHIVQRNDLRFGLGQEFTNEISAYLVLQESLLTGNVSTALKLEHQAELRIIADFENYKFILKPKYVYRNRLQRYTSIASELAYSLNNQFSFVIENIYQTKFL